MLVYARSVQLTGADQQIAAPRATYRGYTVRETAGAAAVIRIHDSTDNSGPILETIALVANESKNEFYDTGIRAQGGIFVDVVSGTVEGAVRHA